MRKVNRFFYIRKGIHLISGYLFIWILRYENSLIYLLGIFVLMVIGLDLMRTYSPWWDNLFSGIFGRFLTPAEKQGGLLGATTLWAGICILFAIWPLHIFYPAAMVMVFSDSLAAIMGKNFALYTFSTGKTVGGTLMFFITTVSIFWYANIPLFATFPFAIILSVIELRWIGPFENLIIGISSASFISILELL